MPRLTLYQHPHDACPSTVSARGLLVTPPSICPYSYRPLLAARGSYFELVDEDGGRVTEPCGSVIEYSGRRLLLLCREPLLDEKCIDVDAVVVTVRHWARPGRALQEARRLAARLMSLSWLCNAPVLFVNVWGFTRSRAYTGYTGVYDYERSTPLHLGVEGDGRVPVYL